MNKKEIQICMAAAGYYTGAIDGALGTVSLKARKRIATAFNIDDTFTDKRQWVAAAQACLNHLGYEAGAADGYDGHNTREAYSALIFARINGKREIVKRVKRETIIAPRGVPHQNDAGAYYGDPVTQVPQRLVTATLPFYMRIDYNRKQQTNKVTLHELAAPSFVAGYTEVWKFYGEDAFRDLGLDLNAGGYNKRKMRGGTSWSMHAYGCAWDNNATPNGLRTRCPDALFCKPVYKDYFDIMESHEWLSALRMWGADAMHLQRASL